MQLLSAQPDAPLPKLPVSVQLFSVQPEAPLPELPVRMQLLSAQPDAPFPELPTMAQLLSVPPEAPPAPLVNVNPDRVAPLARDTHRFELAPLIIVNSAPLTLRTGSAADAWIG